MTARGRLVAGIDFGSDSVRVRVVDADGGGAVLTVSRGYPRWGEGLFCAPERRRFRQHPLDHLETLESCFAEIADRLGDGSVRALAIDTTGSSPTPVDATGVPLALHDDFADDPDAMVWLWKDRTAAAEAAEVDRVLRSGSTDYTAYQGSYSSEWWWAKILRAARVSPRVVGRAASWSEHSDWLPNMLIGSADVRSSRRNACAAGHKALYNSRLGGLVPAPVLSLLDPYLAEVADSIRTPPVPAGTPLGTLSDEWAGRLRLRKDTVVAAGSLDAHAGGVGAGIDGESLVVVMGTSTVEMFLTTYDDIEGKDLRLLCGLAEDSIVPGSLGGETSQAAFGDLFAWFARMLLWPARNIGGGAGGAPTVGEVLSSLEEEAVRRRPSDIVALDWVNGRRYPDVDEHASAALAGLRIGHDAVDVYRALVQAAVLGTKAIHDALAEKGIRFGRVVLVGGIARKSPFICQMLADALNVAVEVRSDDETCATGAAMFAATALGAARDVADAQARFGGGNAAVYGPSSAEAERLEEAFAEYRAVGRLVGSRQGAPQPSAGSEGRG